MISSCVIRVDKVAPAAKTVWGFMSSRSAKSLAKLGRPISQTVLAWLYFRKYWRRDRGYITALASFVLICNACQVGIFSDSGDTAYLGKLIPNLVIELVFTAVTSLFVQVFYCFRIWKLSKQPLIALPVLVLCVASFVLISPFRLLRTKVTFIIATYLSLLTSPDSSLTYTQISQMLSRRTLSTTSMVLSAASSIAISAAMVVVRRLFQHGFKKTTDVADRIVLFTFDTGFPMSVCTILSLITSRAAPETFLYIFFYILVYSNSMFVMLNAKARAQLRGGGHGGQSDQSTSAGQTAFQLTTPLSRSRTNGLAIRIETATQQDTDSQDAKRDQFGAYDASTSKGHAM
ncbi:hypothetical protein BDZ89DRAFT_1044361 [Hymenopellis radicata]|nr:hypothetical protein BDZ89DRAFT_1044361 [Hymenopellis radicata]